MSTRWYPLYQKGNPQLRIFLPNFWMKLVKPQDTNRKNVVQFHVSMQMTKYDVKNYLEKIYNVKVVQVHTRIKLGEISKKMGVTKDDDIKIAYVHLPRNETFTFPDIYGDNTIEKQHEEFKEKMKGEFSEFKQIVNDHNKQNPGVPLWFR